MNVKTDSSHSNLHYSFASPRSQNFSIPKDTILYILNNCISPEVFQKLQQTCKYFSTKKEVIVIDAPVFYYKHNIKNLFYFKRNINEKTKTSLFKKNREKFKYWLTNSLNLSYIEQKPSYPSLFYQCNLKSLTIDNQDLKFDEICFLLNGKSIEALRFNLVKINYSDESPVTIDTILAQCPNIINVYYNNVSDNFSHATMERLNALKFINKLEYFSYGIFEFENGKYEEASELLCKFIKGNVRPQQDKTCISISLYEGLYHYRSEFETFFKKRLEGWVVKINMCASGRRGRQSNRFQ